MNRVGVLIAFLLLMSFVVTFLLTWWIRGWGFGELLELVGKTKPAPDGKGPRRDR